MTNPLDTDAIRARHTSTVMVEHWPEKADCRTCRGSWPCDAIQILDENRDLRQEVERRDGSIDRCRVSYRGLEVDVERLMKEAGDKNEEIARLRRVDAKRFHKSGELENEITRLREALEPFAKVFDVYLDNGLDEARPEWEERHGVDVPENIELLGGRGGKQLLVLADMKRASDTLEPKP
jgi:hypothetical protein